MRKICFAAIMLIFPAAPLWAADQTAPEPAAAQAAPIPLDDAGPVLLAKSETSRVTTFKYSRSAASEKAGAKTAPADESDQTEAKQLQRSRSRPKVNTYGYPGYAPAEAQKAGAPAAPADGDKPIKRGLSEPKVTTFEYKRPAPAQPAPAAVKSVESQPAERRPGASKTARPARKNDGGQATAAAPKAEPAPKAAGKQPAARPADEEPPTPPKDEVKFTTLNPRTEELEMAKPEAVSKRGRAARVKSARKKAENAPAPVTPAFDGSTSFNVAGVYVNCPKNKEENCGQASEEFKIAFPVDQTAPYVLIRKDGRGFLAPDEKRTIAFTWQFLGDNALLIIMEDARHQKVEYRAEGRYLRNMTTGDLFYMSLTDAEWNVTPEPYSKIKARKEKKK